MVEGGSIFKGIVDGVLEIWVVVGGLGITETGFPIFVLVSCSSISARASDPLFIVVHEGIREDVLWQDWYL